MHRVYNITGPGNGATDGWYAPFYTEEDTGTGISALAQRAADKLPEGNHTLLIVYSDDEVALYRVTIDAPRPIIHMTRVRRGI